MQYWCSRFLLVFLFSTANIIKLCTQENIWNYEEILRYLMCSFMISHFLSIFLLSLIFTVHYFQSLLSFHILYCFLHITRLSSALCIFHTFKMSSNTIIQFLVVYSFLSFWLSYYTRCVIWPSSIPRYAFSSFRSILHLSMTDFSFAKYMNWRFQSMWTIVYLKMIVHWLSWRPCYIVYHNCGSVIPIGVHIIDTQVKKKQLAYTIIN